MTRYAPTNKLRAQTRAGLGELQAEQLAVQRMQRMTTETAEIPRHVVVIEDVTRGLGLNQVDEQRIQKAIEGTNAEFSPKTQTQRLFLARGSLHTLLRSMGEVNGDARMEIAKRATAWWKKAADTDLNRSRTVHYISYPQSTMAKGGTHKYKSRKLVGGKWVYDYGDGHGPARGSRESVEEKRSTVKRAQEKQGTTVTAIDPERYPPISGMEGPFRFGSGADKALAGRTLYYDPREGKYYDRDSDMYVGLEKSLTKGGKVERWITVSGARIPIIGGKPAGALADKIFGGKKGKKAAKPGEKKPAAAAEKDKAEAKPAGSKGKADAVRPVYAQRARAAGLGQHEVNAVIAHAGKNDPEGFLLGVTHDLESGQSKKAVFAKHGITAEKGKGKKTTLAQALGEGYEAGEAARIADVRKLAGTVSKQRQRDEQARKSDTPLVFTPPVSRRLDLEWK